MTTTSVQSHRSVKPRALGQESNRNNRDVGPLRVAKPDERRICVLSRQDSGQVERGFKVPCYGPKGKHKHITEATAVDLVSRGVAKWVGKGHRAIAYTRARTWRPTLSAGYTVLQLRP